MDKVRTLLDHVVVAEATPAPFERIDRESLKT
jgi:hypothetical protein